MDRPEWKVFSKFGEWLSKEKKKKKKAGIQSAEGLAGLTRNPHCALQRLVPAVDGAPRAAGSVTQIFTRPASGDIRAQTSQFSTAAEF